MPQRKHDDELEKSTTRWMAVGVGLTALFALMFPFYRLYEPVGREEARANLQASLASQGEEIFQASCASCHGAAGQGVDAPALNSKQFLEAATNEQISSLIAHGIPGTEMSAYSLDFGGFLTSQQINAVTTFLRSLEENAPDRPDWRDMIGAEGEPHDEDAEAGEAEPGHDETPPTTEEPAHD